MPLNGRDAPVWEVDESESRSMRRPDAIEWGPTRAHVISHTYESGCERSDFRMLWTGSRTSPGGASLRDQGWIWLSFGHCERLLGFRRQLSARGGARRLGRLAGFAPLQLAFQPDHLRSELVTLFRHRLQRQFSLR